MSTRQTAQSDAAVEAAIAQLLAAERAARVAVAQVRTDAAAITDRARERARALAQRTERRMHRVRAAFDAATQMRLAEIAADAQRIDNGEQATSADHERVAAAVTALAAALTGGR